MLDIKLTRQNGKSLSLSLPCALTDLITGDAPFYISCGLAELTFHTGNEKRFVGHGRKVARQEAAPYHYRYGAAGFYLVEHGTFPCSSGKISRLS